VKEACWLGDQVVYDELGGKEKESYNSARLKAIMAKWGYLEAFNVNGDKWGADLLFYRSSDGDVLKVQLKGRATVDKHYENKDIYIAFEDKILGKWFLYAHDDVMNQILHTDRLVGTESWDVNGGWSWNKSPIWLLEILKEWEITN
tara:strand:+ start:211 stop:648 length:438 start_codon:yes stop_codon:yes gene_type:complete